MSADTLTPEAPPVPPAETPPDWSAVESLPEYAALSPEQKATVVNHYADTLHSHVVGLGADPAVVGAEIGKFRQEKMSGIYPTQAQPVFLDTSTPGAGSLATQERRKIVTGENPPPATANELSGLAASERDKVAGVPAVGGNVTGAISRPDGFDVSKQDAVSAGFANVMHQGTTSLGDIVKGMAGLAVQYPGLPTSATAEDKMKWLNSSPDPLLQWARQTPEMAEKLFPVNPAYAKNPVVQAVGSAGQLAPIIASGPFAPFVMAMQTAGQHINTDYDSLIKSGMAPEQAAQKTFRNATAAGLTDEVVWSVLPAPLRAAGDKFLIDKFGAEGVKKFLLGRVAQAGEGAVLGATSRISQNAAGGDHLLEGVGSSAAGLSLLQLLTPRGAHGEAPHAPEDIRDYLSNVPTHLLETASADPEFRKSAPYDPKLVDAELAKRHLATAPDASVQIAAGDTGFAGAAPEMHAAVLTELEKRGLSPADAEKVTAIRDAERQAQAARDAGLDETARALLEKADAAREEAVPEKPAGQPDWVKHNIAALAEPLEKSGAADQVEQLSAERLTAKEIANRLSLSPEEIRAVRARRGIPSMDQTAEFNSWLESRKSPPVQEPISQPATGVNQAVVEAPAVSQEAPAASKPVEQMSPAEFYMAETVSPRQAINEAVGSNKPFGAALFAEIEKESGKSTPVPPGYSKEGDLYVYNEKTQIPPQEGRGSEGQVARVVISDQATRRLNTLADNKSLPVLLLRDSKKGLNDAVQQNAQGAYDYAIEQSKRDFPDDPHYTRNFKKIADHIAKEWPNIRKDGEQNGNSSTQRQGSNQSETAPETQKGVLGAEAGSTPARGDIKRFRDYLNAQDTGATKHREGPYQQQTRKYGDYLYAQDRERFDVEMRDWLAKDSSGSSNAGIRDSSTPSDTVSPKDTQAETPPPVEAVSEGAAPSPIRSTERARVDAMHAIIGGDRDLAERTAATINKNLATYGEGRTEYQDAAYDRVTDDLQANREATGDPFRTKNKAGETVPYSITAALRNEIGNLRDKISRREASGEDAALVKENAVAAQSTHQYKSAVEDVIGTTERVLNEFAAGDETKAEAAKLVLRDQGFANGEQGRPTTAAKALAADPAFKAQVQKNVFAKIAAEIKSRFEDSVLDSVRITNNTDALNQATSNVVNAFQPGAMARAGKTIRGWFGAIAGKTLPRFTVADREVGEKGARYISSKIAAEPLAGVFADKVLGDSGVDPKQFGAALTEDNLRSVRQQNLDKAAEAKTPEEAAEYQDRADRTATMIGPKKPFKDEAEYQAFLTDPATQAAIDRHKQMWQDQVEPMYRKAQRLDPDAELPSRGLQTDARINLFALKDGDPGVARVSGPPSGGLLNTLRKKSPFATEAKGTGSNYETAYGEIIKNTFGQQLSIANYNDFVAGMVDKGLAQIGKPGQHVEIDGEGTMSFPLERRTIISDGKVFPANEHVYVKQSLADEFRAAVNVDPSRRAQLAGKVFGIVNNAALYGLTDATVHVSNLATALLTRPAVTGRTITDSLLSTFGRADVPVALTKAIIKGFSDNSSQMAELAAIGAARASSTRTMFGLGWSNKMIHWADGTTRLVLDDAFKNLVKDGLVENTETNRREFVNQIGQYNRRTSTGLNRALKDAGFAPFVTAGTTFNRLGLRMVGLQSGASHTNALSHAITMANVASKWVGAAVLIGATNYLLTHDKGGGLLGRPGVPLGNIDTGETDENDKPLSIPVAGILGLERGLRVTGIRGAVQAYRNELTPGDIKDAALRDIINAGVAPYAGPAVRAMSGVLFNRAPGIGTPPIFRVVPPTGDETQRSQLASNLLHTVADVNPLTAAAVDQKENPSARPIDVLHRQLPRFTLRPSNSIEMMENYPTIVHKAQVNTFIEDTIYTARRLKPGDRQGYVEDQMSQIPAEDQKHLRDQLKRRGVRY